MFDVTKFNGYRELGYAIVHRLVEDYRVALKKESGTLKSLERQLRSEWIKFLSEDIIVVEEAIVEIKRQEGITD